jgi:Heavy metal associated domain 2
MEAHMKTPASGKNAEAREPVLQKRSDNSWASPNTYLHHVKGRLRVQAIVLRGNAAGMQALQQQLGATRGVRKVTSNPIIGSIAIEYAQELELPVLFGTLQSARIELSALPAAHNPNPSTASSPWRGPFAAGFAAHFVLDLLVWGFAGASLMR